MAINSCFHKGTVMQIEKVLINDIVPFRIRAIYDFAVIYL